MTPALSLSQQQDNPFSAPPPRSSSASARGVEAEEEVSFHPISLLSTLCQELLEALPGCCARTDATFQRVFFHKLDERGLPITYDSEGHRITDENAAAESLTQGRVRELHYIEDIATGDLYFDDDMWEVCGKCAALAIAVLPVAVIKITWHLYRLMFNITHIACKVIHALFMLSRSEASPVIVRELKKVPTILCLEIWSIVSSPLFAVGCLVAALYGIAKPYHGRKIVAIFEKAWENGLSYRHDIKHASKRQTSSESLFELLQQNADPKVALYAAYCFQRRDNIHELTRQQAIDILRREPIS